MNSDNWTLLSLITARAGRARIAEITARIEPTYNARTQILLAKIYSHERSHRWPYWLGTTTLVQAERTAPKEVHVTLRTPMVRYIPVNTHNKQLKKDRDLGCSEKCKFLSLLCSRLAKLFPSIPSTIQALEAANESTIGHPRALPVEKELHITRNHLS